MIEKLKGKFRLHASRVDRIAIVDRPAVPDAQIVVFKRLAEEDLIEKGAISFQDLPLADEKTVWDSGAARKAVKAWAGGDNIDWAKYRKAFMWYDDTDAEKEGAYKLPYADIIDGKLTAVPKAIFAIVGAISGARGGIDIPSEDKTRVLAHCKKYYKKMDKEFPAVSIKSWDDPSIFEKDFNSGFCFRAAEAAVDALRCEVWNAIYNEDNTNDEAAIKKVFAEFTDAVLMVLAKVAINKQDAEILLTETDILKPFARGLEFVAMYEAFAYFKSNIAYLIAGSDNLENPEAIIRKVIELFQEFVINSIKNIIANKRQGDVPVFEKEGRKISTARLAKLKSLVSELSTLINEAEAAVAEKTQEVPEMEMKEILEKLEKMEALLKSVEGIAPRLTAIEGALKEKGMLLTEAEVAEKAIAEKKKSLAERAKAVGLDANATEQEVADAEAKAANKKSLEKRAEAVGLAKDSTLEAVEKKEKEVKDAADLVTKNAKEALEKRAEGLGLAKDATLEAVEKKEKELAEVRTAKLEKAVSEIGGVINVIGKRFGVKTSIDADIVEKSTVEGEDVFLKTLKGKQ